MDNILVTNSDGNPKRLSKILAESAETAATFALEIEAVHKYITVELSELFSRIITKNESAVVSATSLVNYAQLIADINRAMLYIVNEMDNELSSIEVLTGTNTVFSVTQAGHQYCKGLTVDIPSKGAGKVLQSDAYGKATWGDLSPTGNELPERIRFVSPTFSNSAPFFSNIDDALNSFTGTLVVYEGTYTPTVSFACNVVAIGKVKIGTVSAGNINIQGNNLTITTLSLNGSTNTNIKALKITSVSLENSDANISVESADYVTLLGSCDLDFSGNINNSFQAVTGDGNVKITSYRIGEINAGGYFNVRVDAEICNAIQAISSATCHLDIKSIETSSNVTFQGFAKVAFYHSNFYFTNSSYMLLQGEVSVKLKNCYMKGSVNRGIIEINTYDQLVVSNTTIVNTDITGYSISSTTVNTDVYFYGDSAGNLANNNINDLVTGFIVDANIANEVYF